MTNILIVEDDPLIAELERDFLEANDYVVHMTENGADALQLLDESQIDAILLDIMLPGEDGYALCRKMREKTDIPIIFVTARKEEVDKIRGLGLGADDYIVKPFSPTELVARLRAHLSTHDRLLKKDTGKPVIEQGLTIDNLTIRPRARQVLLDGKDVPLTGKEFDLLYFLAEHPNEVFSKEQLFEKIWSLDPIGEPATVTVHINRLRDKLKAVSGRPYERIETVWGAGYRFHIE
ncbi:MAG TPA: DNA-binding response regulator [Veillonellaceae bacterium]|jgi:DNA-binding response OmpR family regulator|nr:DNA-binding response regulator [Veillonellaceae bacterium]